MTHGYATQARCFHVKYTHRYILYTHTTMRYRCEILNHGIDGYEVWLHGRNQGRSGVKIIFEEDPVPIASAQKYHISNFYIYFCKRKITENVLQIAQLTRNLGSILQYP